MTLNDNRSPVTRKQIRSMQILGELLYLANTTCIVTKTWDELRIAARRYIIWKHTDYYSIMQLFGNNQ